jgi:RNA polymerase sigma-70 factor (ECF subfamily)
MHAADSRSGQTRAPSGTGRFANTQWSLVLSAANPRDTCQALASLEKLCRAYWPPLYAFVRGQGESPPDAEDLTQAFFARLLEKDFLRAVDREKGRFRSFLLAAMKHFLSNERDKARARKRGGGRVFVPLDCEDAETRYRIEPVEHLTPDKIFQRQWALALLERTMARLREEYTAGGKAELFEALKATLTEGRGGSPYAALGAGLGLSEAAVKMAVHRLRRRYREVLRAEVAETVARPEDVEDELREVFRVFSD